MNQNDNLKYGIAPLPEDPVEAMAYVPFQPYSPALCSPHLGFENGTIFRSLNKPFYGSKCGGDDQ
ncbi:MAG: spore coat associated protein CotJA [Ruminococcus sp.]|nr:spore coat associated protein CotJA [Ruminococcus sp.]